MEGNSDFIQKLETNLSAYGQELEALVLPGLKTDLKSFQTSFATVKTILSKKGFLGDDPYRYDEKLSEVTPVLNDPFMEGERSTVMSIRTANFESQLDFLNNFYQFNLNFLNLQRLKNISAFIRFVRWDSYSENSQEPNTSGLAQLIKKVRTGDDALSTNIITDAQKQLTEGLARIQDKLKRVITFKREEYKYLVRTSLMPQIKISEDEYHRDSDRCLKLVRKDFAGAMPGNPFVPELIREILEEDLSPQSEDLKVNVLEKLRVQTAAKIKKKDTVNFRAILLEALRMMSTAAAPGDGALRKLKDSSAILENRAVTVAERIAQFFSKLVGRGNKTLIYTIEHFDKVSAATRSEDLNFSKFAEDSAVRFQLLASMALKTSTPYLTLTMKSEEEIFDWLDKQTKDLNKTIERMNALDTFFKTEIPRERRHLVRGIKSEIGQLKLVLTNTNKTKHEYISAKEEQEQLRKLGVQV